MKAYDNLAPYYDKFMKFMEYDEEAKALHAFLTATEAKTILDIGVGSGGHFIPLLHNGYRIDALDISRPMLDILKIKLLSQGLNARLFEGDMTTFRTHYPYDVIYALGDTIHHLADISAFKAFLHTSYENLDEGGYLLFTWRQRGYFQDLADLGSFYEEHDEDYLLWDISYEGNTAEIHYTAFIQQEEDDFHRISEKHTLTVFDSEEIEAAAKEAGFHIDTATAKKYFIQEGDEEEFKVTVLLQK